MSNTNVEVKVTIAQKYEALIQYFKDNEVEFDNFDVMEFLQDRKAKSEKSGTKTEKPENAQIRAAIVEYLGTVNKARLGDIAANVNAELGTEYTPNKVSAQLTKLKEANAIVRSEEKRIAYFSIA